MRDLVAVYLAKENLVLLARRWRLGTATIEQLGEAVDALNAELAKGREADREEAA